MIAADAETSNAKGDSADKRKETEHVPANRRENRTVVIGSRKEEPPTYRAAEDANNQHADGKNENLRPGRTRLCLDAICAPGKQAQQEHAKRKQHEAEQSGQPWLDRPSVEFG